MNKKVTSLLTQLLFCASLYAQIPKEPVNALSPNVASLGSYGEYSVSHYTGQPNIEVPLYTLQSKDLSVPISLNCNTSGFRPDMHPGWVGEGWSLNSGGVISRIINGHPDDFHQLGTATNNSNKRGYFFNWSLLNYTNWSDKKHMIELLSENVEHFDYEPDEFTFNFGIYSGKFLLSQNGTWKVKCDKALKVTFNGVFLKAPLPKFYSVNDILANFSGFTITTEDGTQYVFGGSTDAIEYSIGFFSQSSNYWYANSWNLTKIISPNTGEEINFKYERDDYINQMYISAYWEGTSTVKVSGAVENLCSLFGATANLASPFSGKLISPVYLKEISSSQSVINFERSPSVELGIPDDKYRNKYDIWIDEGVKLNDNTPFMAILKYASGGWDYPQCLKKLQWKKLDRIKINDLSGNVKKTFEMAYNNLLTERLRLLSITEKGDLLTKKYSFEYHGNHLGPGQVPYLTDRTDHWGYYNGTDVNYLNPGQYHTSKDVVDVNYTKNGVLKKIIYPTGGITEFEYENNTYSKEMQVERASPPTPTQSVKYAGGLRIKKISSYDLLIPNQKLVKEYLYVDGYYKDCVPSTLTSSGVLPGKFQYFFPDYSIPAATYSNLVLHKQIFSTQCLYPGTNNRPFGDMGYSEVTEKLSDGSYTSYFYYNYGVEVRDDPSDNSLQSRTPYEPFAYRTPWLGKLNQEWKYDSSGEFQSLRWITYNAINESNSYVKSLKGRRNDFWCGRYEGFYAVEGTAYKIYTYSCLPVEEVNAVYEGRGGEGCVVNTKLYTYDDKGLQLITEIKSNNSKGQQTLHRYSYPSTMPAISPSNPLYNAMVANNILSQIIEEKKFVDNVQVSFTRNNYAEAYPGKYLPTSVEAQNLITDPLVTLSTYSYDNLANLITESSLLNAPVSYLWGYNKQYPVAQVTNAKVKNIFYDSFEEGNGNSPLQDDKTGRFSYIGYYSKTLNNLDPGNYILSYWQKTAGVWLQVNTPVTLTTTTYTISLNSQVDDICFHPLDAQMTTYTYEPMVGMTSMTDPKGMATYYDYDGFQRLKNVRDQNGNVLKSLDYNYRINP